ncbi:MAG: fibrobacter succinogenes major paralogous domain-containing protein [Flavobacterium sp.]|nr:fibrobacter succinogenes major paralogous domain-containing protein [Flavobacterium sp.]
MKKIFVLIGLFTVLFATAQPQDTLYVWKAGVLVNIQSIKTADMDSITFKRPPVNPNGINIPGPNVTDIDGNVYASVTNCGLTFTKQNLNVSKYSDGTPIPQVTSTADWANLTTGAWCYYNNDPANGAIYGKLYNWYATAGIFDAASQNNPALRKKLTPNGWHVPTDAEWTQLTECLGGESVAGGKMKATGTIQAGTGLWQEPNTDATNESGFTGLPAGCRDIIGTFYYIGYNGYWWTSSEIQATYAWFGYLDFDGGDTLGAGSVKRSGFSVRCLRD